MLLQTLEFSYENLFIKFYLYRLKCYKEKVGVFQWVGARTWYKVTKITCSLCTSQAEIEHALVSFDLFYGINSPDGEKKMSHLMRHLF